MTDKGLLEKGYFANELPPPFQTKIFAYKLTKIETDWNVITAAINKGSKLPTLPSCQNTKGGL